MKAHLYILLLLCMPASLLAQDNLMTQFGYRGSVLGTQLLPSTMTMDSSRFEIGLGYLAWVANRSISFHSIQKINRQKRISASDIDQLISEMDATNRIGVGQDFLVFGFGFKHMLKGRPFVWSFTVSDRLAVNGIYPKALAQFAWQGNKQFEGQLIDLSETALTGLYFRQFAIGGARTLVEHPSWSFRLGGKLKYFMGLSGLANRSKNLSFTTAANAEFLELDYDIDYAYAGIENFDFFQPRGHGIGGDIGASFLIQDRFGIDLGLSDIGAMWFSNDVGRLEGRETIRFSGLDREALSDPGNFVDSLLAVLEPIQRAGNNFRMPVGMKLSLNFLWKSGTANQQHGHRMVFVNLLTGFREHPGISTAPKLTVAAHRRVLRFVNIGVSASFGGFNQFALGGLLGMEFKHYRFGFHTDDLTGLIVPKLGTGAGGGFTAQIKFGKNRY